MKSLYVYGLSCIVFCLVAQNIQAQQIPQYTQHRLIEIFYNPASTGNSSDILLQTVARGQWLGIQGQPLTAAIALHSAMPILHGGGGISISNDLLGAERHTAAYLQYSYQKRLPKNKQIAVGIEVGTIQKSLNGTKLSTPEGEYENEINHNDPLLPNQSTAAIAFDMGIGIRLQTKNYTIGLSSKHLYATTLKLENLEINLVPHTILYGNYRFTLTNTLDNETNALLKTDFKQIQSDIGIYAYFGQNWIGGLSLRGIGQTESMSALVAAQLNKYWQLGYSFDFILTKLNQASTVGSHEITLAYKIPNKFKSKQGKKTFNPRFL